MGYFISMFWDMALRNYYYFLVIIFAFCIISICPADSIGQVPAKTGVEIPVNSTTADIQTASSIALNTTDGSYVVVWETSGQDGSLTAVYGQLFASNGATVGGDFQVNTTTAQRQENPSVALNSTDGSFVVVWESFNQDAGQFGVIGQRFNSSGTKVGGEFIANTEEAQSQQNPSIALNSTDGSFVVVWESFNQDASNEGVFGQRFNSSATKVGGEFQVNTVEAGAQMNAVVAISSDGTFVVIWQSNGQDGGGEGIFGQRYNADGTVNGVEFPVNSTTANDQINPSVDINSSDGSFVVVWQDAALDAGGDEGIFGQRYDNTGATVGGEFQVNTTTANDQINPQIAINDNDLTFVVVWQDAALDAGGDEGVFLQRYDMNGNKFGGEIQVNTTTAGNQTLPVVQINPSDGSYIFAWSDDVLDGSSEGIFAQKFTALLILAFDTIADTSIQETNTLQITPSTVYNGGGTLVYSVTATFPASEDTTFNTTTGVLTWNTTFTSSGTFTVTIQATDGTYTRSRSFTITITDFIFLFTANPDVTIKEGISLTVIPIVSYNGPGTLSYAFSASFPGTEDATINSSTGIFVWKTSIASDGRFTVTMQSSDGTFSVSDTFSVTVEDFVFGVDVFSDPDTVFVIGDNGDTLQVKIAAFYKKHDVIIPPGALPVEGTVTLRAAEVVGDGIPLEKLIPVPSALSLQLSGFSPGQVVLNDSITVIVEYKDSDIRANVEDLKVHFWDPLKQRWTRVRSEHVFELDNQTITVKVTQFGVYGILQLIDFTSPNPIKFGWNMISIPLELDLDEIPKDIFGSHFSFFQLIFENSSLYNFNEPDSAWVVPKFVNFNQGYILWSNEKEDIEIPYFGLPLTWPESKSLQLEKVGWNLVGNPFNVAINWDLDIEKPLGIHDFYYWWDGTEYLFYPGGGLTARIPAGRAFWVKTPSDSSSLEFTIPTSIRKSNPVSQLFDWRIQVIGESGDLQDTQNYMGVAEDALGGYDTYDVHEIRQLGDRFLSVYFPHGDWNERSGDYTQDIHPRTEDKLEWNMSVATNSSEPVRLTWIIPEELRNIKTVMLTHSITGKTIDMLQQSEYIFLAKNSKEDFTVTVQNALDEESSLIPDVYYLMQNYPNPFNPTTTIKYGLPEDGHVTLQIFNILGQEVATLVNTEQTAGIKSIVWNSTNSAGKTVSNGIYFYRISAGSFVQIKRLLVIK